MSYSSVCQGFHSCLKPCTNLSRPSSSSNSSIISSLSFSESDTYEKKPLTNTSTKNYGHDTKSEARGCFSSFLQVQSLSNISHFNKIEGPEAQNVYVHPTVKGSSSMLSAKSLELCTESLGCETGSTDDMSLFSFECSSSSSVMRNTPIVNQNSGSKRLKRDSSSFPPPLTSMTDLGGFQVRSHREDGRLILEAVTFSSPQLYLQAQRGNSRLRLRLFESSVSSYYGDDEGEAETLNQLEACWEEDTNGAEEEMEEYVRNGEDEMGMNDSVSVC